MATCPGVSTGGAFLSSLLEHIDCQGRTIGALGYQSLADPGSPLSLLITSLLTIFIALFGLRMILGRAPGVKDNVTAVLKVGVVLLIAASWPAYRTVVYDVIVQGPAQLSAAIGAPAGLPGANGDLVRRLQTSDDAIARLTTLGSGRSDLTSRAPRDQNGVALPQERAPLADDLAFGSARILFLSGVVAAFALVRLGAGILLALAPLFAGLLLFDIARGLFVGWVRALVFTLLASVAVTLILGVQLALLEPWLAQALQLRQAKVVVAEAPVELLVLCLAFALATAGALWLMMRLAFAVHIPALSHIEAPATSAETPNALGPTHAAATAPTRAAAIANALSAAQRREGAYRIGPASSRSLRAAVQSAGAGPATTPALLTTSSGQPARRTRARKSQAATLRDRRP